MKNFYALLIISLFFINVSAQTKGSLSCKVLDASGNPITGATIRLEPDRHMAESNKKGEFLFNNLYAGNYQVFVHMLGFKEYHTQVTVTVSQVTRVDVSLVQEEKELDDVEISTKKDDPDNLMQVERSAMPVTIISRSTIEKMGSRRLDEVLKEQTGIAIVNNISGGARSVGIQMQGFGSEYIMILIDGQPMVGRNNGNFDLSRISVANIERIEIIKGASSCLFGSDALGGAINIVTRYGAVVPQGMASIAYGSLNITDATIEGETPFASQRGSANVSANYYHSDGFNTNPSYIQAGTTAPPYDNYAVQGRLRYQLTKNGILSLSGRYGLRRSFMEKDFGLGNVSKDTQDEQEINLGANYNYTFSSGVKSVTRYYYTDFNSDMNVFWQNSASAVTNEVFKQRLHRLEQQFAYRLDNHVNFTAGLGGSTETMRDASLTNPAAMNAAFVYAQGDVKITEKIGAVAGLRYDYTNNYAGRVNPSLGLQYQVLPKLQLKAGFGTGFKAPDFKTRYLVFYNPVANYLVIGNEVLKTTLDELQAQGQISEIRNYLLSTLNENLKAEKSKSLNASVAWSPKEWLKLEGGVFYHKLRNQINSIQVATGSNNRNIYTYQNLPEAVNKGIDALLKITPLKDMEISMGYQFLIAKDLSVIDSIAKGNYPYNQNIHDPATGNSYPVSTNDYWGIENRSRHMFNLQAFYTYRPLDLGVNARVNYRGKYPFGDRNGNQFIDRYDTFVQGYFLLNASIEKKILKQHASIRLTADNLLNYTDMLIPGQPGRVILAGLSYRFFKD
ncbi:TonB-dependent receptor [Pedobacter sp. MW01-1-1]|uniref:TonB-dependent receptor n=1 Tax=Pedobacter sp. MW01-1-1 TaxID=3383027 RepID=UPI003FEF3F90